MPLIDDFIARYRKEYDFYEQAARLVAQVLDGNLHAAGIRSIVTSRAKAITRLETKVRQRDFVKPYSSVADIFGDIVDLAGARVALYFPAERSQVEGIIKEMFHIVGTPRQFPGEQKQPEKYTKKFSGYWATHYRVHMRESSLSDAQRRYAEALVEIQVASVLMHAWSEVEHDLAYKPLQGVLSDEEYAILDELNGLVIAGEIALERLQKAGEARVAAGGRTFNNHYELAAHLLQAAGSIHSESVAANSIGRVDQLFELLKRLNLATPDTLKPYLLALHADTERRPLSEQIIDQLLAEDDTRYDIYREIKETQARFGTGIPEILEPETYNAIGFFIAKWIAFERAVRKRLQHSAILPGETRSLIPSTRVLVSYGLLDDEGRREAEGIRRIRNNLVHGAETPSAGVLFEAGLRIAALTAKLGEAPHDLA